MESTLSTEINLLPHGAQGHILTAYIFVTCSEKIPVGGRRDVAGSNEVYKDYLFQLKIMPGAMQQERENVSKLHKNRMDE